MASGGSASPDFQEQDCDREGQRTKNQPGRAEHNQAADDGHESGDGVESQSVPNQNGINDVVDPADEHTAP